MTTAAMYGERHRGRGGLVSRGRTHLCAAALGLALLSCGSRSTLETPSGARAVPGRVDAGTPDAGPRDAGVDAGPFDGGPPIQLCEGSLMGGLAGATPFGEVDMRIRELTLGDCCNPFPGRAFMEFEGPAGDRIALVFVYDATCEGGGRRVTTEGVRTDTMEATYTAADGTRTTALVRIDWEIGELVEVPPLGPHRASILGRVGNDEWEATISFGGDFCEWAQLLC